MPVTSSSSAPITLLDGALGTTLEHLTPQSAEIIKTSPLWASDPRLVDDVRGVHEGFLQGGAELVGSSTYQSSRSLYESYDPTLTPSQIGNHMRQGVLIARDAVRAHSNKAEKGVEARERSRKRGRGVGLCLGPFGATLRPGQEYDGIYPPPYGPDPSSNTSSSSIISSSPPASTLDRPRGDVLRFAARPRATREHLQALTEFHFDRLLTFANINPFEPSKHFQHPEPSSANQSSTLEETGKLDPQEAWRAIEWICFEAVPLLVEAVAIRRAMGMLERVLQERFEGDTLGDGDEGADGAGRRQGREDRVLEDVGSRDEFSRTGVRPWWRKRFWISFVYPTSHGGNAPDGTSIQDRTEAMLSPSSDDALRVLARDDTTEDPSAGSEQSEGQGSWPIPEGLGVNCTSPAYVGKIVDEMTSAAVRYGLAAREGRGSRPAIVIYPDGGLVYDPLTRTWSAPPSLSASAQDGSNETLNQSGEESSWAKNIASIARRAALARDLTDELVWSEVLVGGCCKAGFEEIKGLAQELGKA